MHHRRKIPPEQHQQKVKDDNGVHCCIHANIHQTYPAGQKEPHGPSVTADILLESENVHPKSRLHASSRGSILASVKYTYPSNLLIKRNSFYWFWIQRYSPTSCVFFYTSFSALNKYYCWKQQFPSVNTGTRLLAHQVLPGLQPPFHGYAAVASSCPMLAGPGVCQGASFLYQFRAVMIRPKRPLLWRRIMSHNASHLSSACASMFTHNLKDFILCVLVFGLH